MHEDIKVREKKWGVVDGVTADILLTTHKYGLHTHFYLVMRARVTEELIKSSRGGGPLMRVCRNRIVSMGEHLIECFKTMPCTVHWRAGPEYTIERDFERRAHHIQHFQRGTFINIEEEDNVL